MGGGQRLRSPGVSRPPPLGIVGARGGADGAAVCLSRVKLAPRDAAPFLLYPWRIT
jgi:hypothetical protein